MKSIILSRRISILILLVIFFLILFSTNHFNQVFSKENSKIEVEILKIKNGISQVDLNNDRVEDLIVKGYRNNISSHSYSLYSFYIKDPQSNKLSLIEIEDNDDIYRTVSTIEGGGKIKRDLRLIKKGVQYYLVLAVIQAKNIFYEKGKVQLKVFELVYDDIEERYIFQEIKKEMTKKKYSDVEEVFVNVRIRFDS